MRWEITCNKGPRPQNGDIVVHGQHLSQSQGHRGALFWRLSIINPLGVINIARNQLKKIWIWILVVGGLRTVCCHHRYDLGLQASVFGSVWSHNAGTVLKDYFCSMCFLFNMAKTINMKLAFQYKGLFSCTVVMWFVILIHQYHSALYCWEYPSSSLKQI